QVVSAVSAVNAFYSEVNPATLSGAIDVVVVQYPDGELVCSPFHVRFGKLKLLRPHDKAVEVSVNGEVTELLMKVGEAGEAFFVVETENPVPSEYATSPIQQPQAVDSSMEVLDLDAPAVDGPTVVGPNGEALSPTAYGYVSAHGSDIEEDEYPVTDASQGATIEVKPDGKLDASNHSLAAPTTPNMAHSSKSSNKGSELPIDADDVVQSYAHDAAMMGIPSKSSRNYRKKSADVNVSDLISKAVSDFTDSPTNPSPVTHGSDTFSPASNPANLAIPETRTRRRRASHSSVSSDLPIDAEDVAQSFAADANLVGMTQSSVDKNPDVNGIVETTPIPLSSMSVDEKVNNYLAGLPDSKGKESPVTPAGGDPTSHGDISPEPSVANAQSPERSSTPLHPERPLSFEGPISFAFNADIQMEVSACGYDKIRSLGTEEAEDLFQKNLVPFETVVKTPDALSDPTLVYKINGNYYSWAVAGPMIVANLAYRKPLPESAAQRLHHQHHPASPGQSTADNKRYSFIPLKGWWGRTNSTKTVTQLEGTSKDNLVDEGERPAGAIVEEESQDVKSQSPRGSPEPEATSPVVGKFPLKFAKSLRLTSEQLRSLNLKKGPNTITFAVPQSGASVTAKLFLFHHDCRIVISDIDGTITKSDALGHIFTMVGKDWTHLGIASLYTNIRNNGYHILYLTSRAIGQASSTREYLSKVEQGGYQLPEGPVIMSPDRLFASFHREVILRKPEEFKMACLRDIKRLFGERTPFYAGFGNRITDAMSYRSVDVPASRIFTIDPAGDVKLELLAEYKSSYVKLNDIVDQIFPPINDGSVVAPEFNDWNYWKEALPKIELPMDAGDALSDNSSFDSGDDEGYEDDGGADNDDFTEDGSEPDSN
ncbi:Lipin/Ned1/Smp2-domain-containing protein, partial [Phlyctochytrium arcticum]